MNTQLRIKKIGNSAGVILPKDLLAHLECLGARAAKRRQRYDPEQELVALGSG